MTTIPKYKIAFESRDDLKAFSPNALLLFALETRFHLDDIKTVATTALTDGGDDKKCDLIYVDRDRRCVVVAQGYEAAVPKETGKANKASDLNTAIAWLLLMDISELPVRIKSAAQEVRQALTDGEISTFQLWYVHNSPQSSKVNAELQANELALRAALKEKGYVVEAVAAVEVGVETLDEWYAALEAPILVSDTFRILVDGYYTINSTGWKAIVAPIPAAWLYKIWNDHKSKLLSANVRDYLGSRNSDKNVNSGIKDTASQRPDYFWVFNNGITALVNDISIEQSEEGTTLIVKGLSIVNGAQTTGAIGTLDEAPHPSAMIPARFVKCSDNSAVMDIVQYNNTQNSVKAADFRSNDSIQRRLREEFKVIPSALYTGGRRGGTDDAIKRPPNLLSAETCSQALACFHQEPILAYHKKGELWENDNHYSKIFSEMTHANHVLFCYALLKSIEDRKISLSKNSTLIELEQLELKFYGTRGATFLATAAIAACLETLTSRSIPNAFRVSFGAKTPVRAIANWIPIVESVAPFMDILMPAVEIGFNSKESLVLPIKQFKMMVAATKKSNSAIFEEFSSAVVISS